jgi:hypothetical protein
MKIDIEKIEFKKLTDNNFSVLYDGGFLKFWCNKLFLPFGLEHEYNKTIIKLELNNENESDNHLKKVIYHIENLIKKKLNINDNEFKSIIKKRPNKSDILEIRIKSIKNNLITNIEYEDKDNNYLKTLYDLPKKSFVNTQIEINALWDYRTDKKENNKCGLIVYATKILVLK